MPTRRAVDVPRPGSPPVARQLGTGNHKYSCIVDIVGEGRYVHQLRSETLAAAGRSAGCTGLALKAVLVGRVVRVPVAVVGSGGHRLARLLRQPFTHVVVLVGRDCSPNCVHQVAACRKEQA